MSIDSPAGPLFTLEETVAEARDWGDALESKFTWPVLLVVAPQEPWLDITQVRTASEEEPSVQMLPTLVFGIRKQRGEGDIVFGRAGDNDVILPFAAVSKKHGVFREAGSGWLFSDIGSKNGSYVDGKRVLDAPVPLRDGASLRFGDVTARFRLPQTFCADLRRRM